MTNPRIDLQASLEFALGGFVVSYGQLMVLVKFAATSMVNPRDPAIGGLWLDRCNDAQIEDAWWRLAKYHGAANEARVKSIEAMHKDMADLRRDRNTNVHCGYIALTEGDPANVGEYRAAPRGRWEVREGAFVTPTPVEIADIHKLTERCEAIRIKFMSEFVPKGTG